MSTTVDIPWQNGANWLRSLLQIPWQAVFIIGLVLSIIVGPSSQFAFAGNVLPEFAYREISVQFVQLDGKPVVDAAVYGYCHELNLIVPRNEHEPKGGSDVLWNESFLGKTNAAGKIIAAVPPGKWGFFAVGQTAKPEGMTIASWSDFRERAVGEVIRLAPTATKRWVLCSANAAALTPKRIFLKPDKFPIWISTHLASTTQPIQMEIASGDFQLWATGDAAADQPGFALNWGTLNSQMADGNIVASDKTAAVEFKGGGEHSSLSWLCRENFGLEGELDLSTDAKIMLSPGKYSLGYRRPITSQVFGSFVPQYYNLQADQTVSLNLDTPLKAGLDEAVEAGKKTSKLCAQLYLVDGNGHLLDELYNSAHQSILIGAAAILNGKRIAAPQVVHKVEATENDEEGDETSDRFGSLLFAADLGNNSPGTGTVWEFTAPPSVLSETRLTKSERITVTSPTFKMEVPKVIEQHAANVLVQMEELAATMNTMANRRRHIEATRITIVPEHVGASAAHNGSAIKIGALFLFSNTPIWVHTIAHELGHNFGFHHGGLHETVVETSRCEGGDQITEQAAKWMFLDRMNGLVRKETPYPRYPNVGLYLYCYAQAGQGFLHFMSINEYAVIDKLKPQNYTTDEVITALLSLSLGRDMTQICTNYGLKITPGRVSQAIDAARPLCKTE